VKRTNERRREEEKGSWEDILVNPATRSQLPIVWRGEDEDRERQRERERESLKETGRSCQASVTTTMEPGHVNINQKG
jgi:hypothetical protein